MRILCLNDVLQFGLLFGQRIKVGIGFGVIGIDLLKTRQSINRLLQPFFDIAADIFFRIQLRLLRQVANLDVRLCPRLTENVSINPRHYFQQG